MSRRSLITRLVAGTLIAGTCGRPDASAEMVVSRAPVLTGKGAVTAWTGVRLDSGRRIYEIRSDGRAVGLGPLTENWYGNGFLSVTIGRTHVTETPGEMDIAEVTPSCARVRMTWSLPVGPVAAEFELRDNDDKLLLTVELPRATGPAGVRLLCYPATFAGGYRQGKVLRQRRCTTSRRAIVPGARESVDTPLTEDEPWVLFSDDHFDLAQGRGTGPCAALYFPHEVETATARTTNYSCHLDLRARAGIERLHLVLWEFAGMPNAVAHDYMRWLELIPVRE